MNDYDVFKDGWESENTVCGWGSQMEHTEHIREILPDMIKAHGFKTINDAGCGDFWWMRNVDLSAVDYMGYDIYDRRNGFDFPFTKLDIVKEDMRPCDLIICRDVFIHLPNNMILEALERFKRVGKYLLSTSYYVPDHGNYLRPETPQLKHSKLDLSQQPFGLGVAFGSFSEDSERKCCKLWKL